MSAPSTLNRLNHLHLRVDNRTNIVLINIMTLILILYSAVGIIYFATPDLEYWPFLLAYSAWIVIGLYMMAFYRDRPFTVVGLYMLVIGMENLIAWYPIMDDLLLYILQIIPSIWMVVSGIMWISGKVISRYPAMISTAFVLVMNVFELVFIIENPDMIETIPLNVISFILQFIMYVMLIIILACNDTNELPSEKKSLSRRGRSKRSR